MLYSECDRGMRDDGDGSSGDSLFVVALWDDACGGMVLGVSSHSESPNIVLSNCMDPTNRSLLYLFVYALFVYAVCFYGLLF